MKTMHSLYSVNQLEMLETVFEASWDKDNILDQIDQILDLEFYQNDFNVSKHIMKMHSNIRIA